MAYRDKSQGFGFVYVDVQKLLAEREDWQRNPIGKLNSGEVETANFPQPEKAAPATTTPTVPPTPAPTATQPEPSTLDIRKNLDRLQSLHHKLHAMLEELNRLADKKR